MIYQPSKYHSNTFTHFLQLHSSIANNHTNINNNAPNINPRNLDLENGKLELHDQNSSSNTSLVNESVGKNFTIAAILGLKKNSQLGLGNRHGEIDDPVPNLNDYNNEFSNIINLTTHSKLFQKFESENRHNYMQQQQQHHQSTNDHPHMQKDQCMYENNNTSNSSYQEHLHKQLNQEFNQQSILNNNYNRNSVDPSNNATNSTLRNHLQQHPNTNLMNKSINRERNRLGLLLHFHINKFLNILNSSNLLSLIFKDHFPNKSKSVSSVTLKNKRVRTIFTPEQLERLEAEFERQQYMVGPERLYLAHTLQLTEAQVKVWVRYCFIFIKN